MPPLSVKICIGTTCYLLGASKLVDIANRFPPAWRGRVEVGGCTCLDLCDEGGICRAPFAKVGDTVVERATPETLLAAIAEALGEPYPTDNAAAGSEGGAS